MPASLFELIMTFVFIAAVILGLGIIALGFMQKRVRVTFWLYGLGVSLPFGALLVLWLGTEG